MVPGVGPPVSQRKTASAITGPLDGIAVFYGIIYLSILNEINREKVGTTVKTWFGGDSQSIVDAREREEAEIKASFKFTRKRVSGGH